MRRTTRVALIGVAAIAFALNGASVAFAQDDGIPSWLTDLETAANASAPAAGPTTTKNATTPTGPKQPEWAKERAAKRKEFKNTPADPVISAVLPLPLAGQRAFVQLTNMGGKDVDLSGYKLRLTSQTNGSSDAYTFSSANGCPTLLKSQEAMLLFKKDASNACGFSFELGPSEELLLFEDASDPEGVDSLPWAAVPRGNVIYRASEDEYHLAPKNVEGGILTVLAQLGDMKNMAYFLKVSLGVMDGLIRTWGMGVRAVHAVRACVQQQTTDN